MRTLPAILALVLIGSAALAQSTWHVDASASPPGNGSAAQPYSDLQFALAHASTVSGDTVLVEPGTYVGAFDFLGKDVTVRSTQGAAVTILDGNDQLVSVVSFVNGEGPGAVLDGFTVTRGRGSLCTVPPITPNIAREGGGIRCSNTSPLLSNLRVVRNRAARGGGIMLLNSAAVVSHCEISSNDCGFQASVYGAGLFSNLPSVLIDTCTIANNTIYPEGFGAGFCGRATLRDCVVRGNRAKSGCGVYTFGATFERCTFEDNHYISDTVNLRGVGGAISHRGESGHIFNMTGFVEAPSTAMDCLFVGNSASWGGAVACRPGSSFTVTHSTLTGNYLQVDQALLRFGGASWNVDLVECEITGNTGGLGGGVYGGSATRCAIHGNTAFWGTIADDDCGGGGAYGANLVDCDLFDNAAIPSTQVAPRGGFGGGSFGGTAQNCRYSRNTAERRGGAAGGTIVNCTFFENTAVSGGSLASTNGPGVAIVHDLTALNVIARWGTPDEVSQQGAAIAVVTYSNVQGGYPGTGNFDADPLFFAPHSGDYHLKPGSPCIDAGDPSSPLDADGSRADVGAWPFDPNYCSSPDVWCVGKPNSQGCVPSMEFSGTPSATGADNFFVTASNFLGQSFGLLAWSRTPDSIPFQGGTLCIAGPFFRAGMQLSSGTGGACDGTYSFHFSQSYRAAFGINTYETIYAQWFARDALNPDGTGWSLSNALEFTVCP